MALLSDRERTRDEIETVTGLHATRVLSALNQLGKCGLVEYYRSNGRVIWRQKLRWDVRRVLPMLVTDYQIGSANAG